MRSKFMRSKTKLMIFHKMLLRQQRRSYSPKRKLGWEGVLSLRKISERWEEITGKPDSSSWLKQLKKRAMDENWTTTLDILNHYDLRYLAKLVKEKKIDNVFMFVNDPQERRALAQFLLREKIDLDTLLI